ncbi:protein kinase domain-containing protein [Actinacidiphila bryophytorum]|uniref:protein kinase domain-containing protein n=1 Tax=Actinacidiphila bryophytorum TaxID=1436133 RepID=UPI0021769C7D|nr:protein kinase [Actinacidiphila bryophytorum]UWE10327.1 protein kinase [Actinacidiphila bryophytorum]
MAFESRQHRVPQLERAAAGAWRSREGRGLPAAGPTAIGTYGGLLPAAVRLLAAALAEALVDIHRAGLAHLDVKPENIMLTAGGPRAIDFGIVRPDDATAITVPGALLGTAGFTSPEQASGGFAGSDSDVFARGAVLAYAATGREPFSVGDRASTLERVPARADGSRRLTDRPLRALVASCLRREPGQRPCPRAAPCRAHRRGLDHRATPPCHRPRRQIRPRGDRDPLGHDAPDSPPTHRSRPATGPDPKPPRQVL